MPESSWAGRSERNLKLTTSRGKKNENSSFVANRRDLGSHVVHHRTDAVGVRTGAAIQCTGKRLQSAQSAALERDRGAAGAHYAAARSDQSRCEQRIAVPIGRLGDAPHG